MKHLKGIMEGRGRLHLEYIVICFTHNEIEPSMILNRLTGRLEQNLEVLQVLPAFVSLLYLSA